MALIKEQEYPCINSLQI